jgi:hypothetical protein
MLATRAELKPMKARTSRTIAYDSFETSFRAQL